jgi:3-hydroxyacyl-CoA dehydrogenase/enoyl-CoA hydratase/3-hydroxybutyryl-CoA epimerase
MQYEPSALASAPLLFTNTSTISITQLAEVLPPDWRKRFCGFHFFHPVNINPIVEIIAGKETAAETIETAKQHVVRVRKKPICVGDGPGFLVNRILNAYLSAALQLLENGENTARIDQAALDFGMRMGPFRIMDEIGLDVVLHSGWVLHKAFPERVPQSLMLVDLVQNGKHGKKTGQGFYRWSNGEIDDTNSSHAGQKEFDTEKMLINPMRDEAKRCLDDGIISDLSLADFVSVQALGFPSDKVFTNRKK